MRRANGKRVAFGAGAHPDPTTGFIRQPQSHSPACRMNPAFRFVCSAAVALVSRCAPPSPAPRDTATTD